jgi:hypothetical protein
VTAGQVFTLTLGSSDTSNDQMSKWVINWGDGTTQTVTAATEKQSGGKWITTTTATHTFTKSGSYTISATGTDATGTSAAGNTVTVKCNPGAASMLVFETQPSNTQTNSTFAATIYVEDAYGNLVTTNSSSITLSLAGGSGSLGGTVTVSAVNGVATFSNLTTNSAGTYTLTAKDGTLSSATSSSFVISTASQSYHHRGGRRGY